MEILDGDSVQQAKADMTWQSYGYARQPRMVLRSGQLYPKTEADATIVRKLIRDKKAKRIDLDTQLPVRFEDPDGEVLANDIIIGIQNGRIVRVSDND